MKKPMSRAIGEHIRRNVYGLVAVFIALGGTAWAVETMPKNSVVSKSIKNGQVKTRDLGAGAVSGVSLAPGAVTSAAVADDSLTGEDVDETSFDGSVLQLRIGGGCSAGSAIRSIAANGTVTCDPGDDAAYTASAPLTLDGNDFGLTAACADGQVLKSDASGEWSCANDTDTDTNSGGDVTGVIAGTGLSGGGTSGEVALAVGTAFRLPQGCSSGQVAKSDGASSWTCAADIDTTDSAGQILTKLLTVDGSGSGLNADQLDGFTVADFRLACPAGYIRIDALCWENIDETGLSFVQGANECRSEGGRLPSWDEMAGAMQSGVALGGGGVSGDWLGDATSATTALKMNSATDPNAVVEAAVTSTTNFTRCVIAPKPAIGFAP
jgi:hypothetical protein